MPRPSDQGYACHPRDDLVFYAVEASGPGPNSFPIEIGWATAGLNCESYMIRPPPAWLARPDSWSEDSAALHKLTLDDLFRHGKSPDEMTARMNKVLAGKTLCSDAPEHDWWLWGIQIFSPVGPQFEPICQSAATLMLDVAESLGISDADYERIESEVDRFAPKEHRAAPDALHWAYFYRTLCAFGQDQRRRLEDHHPSSECSDAPEISEVLLTRESARCDAAPQRHRTSSNGRWTPVHRSTVGRPQRAAQPYDAVLWCVCKRLPQDYTPYGQNPRWADPDASYPDCASGCRFFVPLHVRAGDDLARPDYEGSSLDWGVCVNGASHRCGLLTFEHQGCERFEPDDYRPWHDLQPGGADK